MDGIRGALSRGAARRGEPGGGMKRAALVCFVFLSLTAIHAEDFLDRVDEALTFSGWNDRAEVSDGGARVPFAGSSEW